MREDSNLWNKLDEAARHLEVLKFNQLMNQPDRIVSTDSGKLVYVGFGAYTCQSLLDNQPVLMELTIWGLDAPGRYGEVVPIAGKVSFILEYFDAAPMKVADRNMKVTQAWFANWLYDNIDAVINSVIQANEQRVSFGCVA